MGRRTSGDCRACPLVPPEFFVSSCTCSERAVPRPPLSVSSACHAHPDDRPEIEGADSRTRLDDAYRLHSPWLLRFLQRKAGPEAAPDLVQEVFARAAGSEQRGRLVNPGGFLRRIAQNLLIDRARRRQTAPAPTFSFCEDRDGASAAQQEWNIEAADLLRLYEEAVATMPGKTRRVFLMHRVDELSYREIHEILGISIATVEYHIMKALRHIAKAVDSGR